VENSSYICQIKVENMTKQEQIEQYLKEPLKIGETIYVQGLGSQDKKSWSGTTKVVDIIDGVPYIQEYRTKTKVEVPWKKWVGDVGANPFPDTWDRIDNISFTLESVIFQLFKEDRYDIKGTSIHASNDNPFVFINGEKKYYQRPLVWSLKDKQLLIESIYNNVDCGKILVRNRSWDELRVLQKGGHELAWKDIVDGKQRINAIKDFLDDKFPDMHGNYYNDLSDRAQRRLTNHQLFSYSELPENTKDEDVLKQFLRLNFSGVPQSQEHLNYVKSLL
jgi:hypothetical protein